MNQDFLNALFYLRFDGTLLAQNPPFLIVKTEKRGEPASSIAADPREKASISLDVKQRL